MAKKKRRRRRSAKVTALMKRAKVSGWTAAYAYAKEKSSWGPKMMALPSLDAIGYDATMAIAAHYLAKHGPRITRKPLDALATGLAGVVGYRFGAAGFKIQGLGGGGVGEDDGGAMEGEVDPNEFDDDDDDDE